jgi:hypothetical protein
MKRITILLIGLIFIVSCDCYQRVAGTVIDSETGRPLQGVAVYNKKKEWNNTVTDTSGNFELSGVSGGFRCAPMTVVVQHPGYQTNETRIPAGRRDTLKLSR